MAGAIYAPVRGVIVHRPVLPQARPAARRARRRPADRARSRACTAIARRHRHRARGSALRCECRQPHRSTEASRPVPSRLQGFCAQEPVTDAANMARRASFILELFTENLVILFASAHRSGITDLACPHCKTAVAYKVTFNCGTCNVYPIKATSTSAAIDKATIELKIPPSTAKLATSCSRRRRCGPSATTRGAHHYLCRSLAARRRVEPHRRVIVAPRAHLLRTSGSVTACGPGGTSRHRFSGATSLLAWLSGARSHIGYAVPGRAWMPRAPSQRAAPAPRGRSPVGPADAARRPRARGRGGPGGDARRSASGRPHQ